MPTNDPGPVAVPAKPRRALCRAVTATCVLALAALLPTADAARFDFDAAGGRLPKDVRPAHYRLELALDPATPRFTGIVEIA